MLDRHTILKLFEKLNAKLAQKNTRGEVGIVGGAVMCLVYDARQATKDVDAIFAPTTLIRELAHQISEEEELEDGWLNDGAKGYLVAGFEKNEVLTLSHLTVWAPEPKYMLAMKCLSARFDSEDGNDVRFLIKHLKLSTVVQVLDIVSKYYPKNQIPAKTTFFLEEIFEAEKK